MSIKRKREDPMKTVRVVEDEYGRRYHAYDDFSLSVEGDVSEIPLAGKIRNIRKPCYPTDSMANEIIKRNMPSSVLNQSLDVASSKIRDTVSKNMEDALWDSLIKSSGVPKELLGFDRNTVTIYGLKFNVDESSISLSYDEKDLIIRCIHLALKEGLWDSKDFDDDNFKSILKKLGYIGDPEEALDKLSRYD